MSKMTKSETATPAAGRNTDKLLEMDMVANMEVDKLTPTLTWNSNLVRNLVAGVG